MHLKRTRVGVATLVLLAAAVVLWLVKPANYEVWMAATIRIGLVMGALWLALPQLQQFPNWLTKLAVLALMVVLCLRHPQTLVLVIVVALAIGMLRPRLREMWRRARR